MNAAEARDRNCEMSRSRFSSSNGTALIVFSVYHGGGRVIDGTKQPGDVTERTDLGSAVRDRCRRFALEVDDVSVAAGDQDLAEMKVAVNARLQRSRARLGQIAHRCDDAAR